VTIKKINSALDKKNISFGDLQCKLVVFTTLIVEKKMSTSRSRKMATARIQRAVSGYGIPLMSIVKLYSVLNDAILAGKTDDELRSLVANYPGVTGGQS
jgi:hypothetical protein